MPRSKLSVVRAKGASVVRDARHVSSLGVVVENGLVLLRLAELDVHHIETMLRVLTSRKRSNDLEDVYPLWRLRSVLVQRLGGFAGMAGVTASASIVFIEAILKRGFALRHFCP